MKKVYVMMGLCLIFILQVTTGYCQLEGGFTLVPISSQKIGISSTKMTSLIFPGSIKAGIKVSGDISVLRVKGLENAIEIRAIAPNFEPTNLSIYCGDGYLYSFDLYYDSLPTILNYRIKHGGNEANSEVDFTNISSPIQITGLPTDEITLSQHAQELSNRRGFLHKAVSHEDIRMRIKGIYVKDSLLWMTFKIQNYSQVPYRPQYFKLSILDKKRAKRTAVQQVPIDPIFLKLPESIVKTNTFSIGFPLFTIDETKILIAQIEEQNGGRSLQMKLSHKLLLKAKK